MRRWAVWLYATGGLLGASLPGCGQSGPLTLREAPPAEAPPEGPADAPAEQAPDEQDDDESEPRQG
jgi:predicted small lipoprotein YifL